MREQADFDERDFESREAGDKHVYVKFYIKPVRDDAESDKEGRPIYRDREYLEIRTPGNATNIVIRPVTDMDRQRFRAQYQQFKSGESEQLIGTPLTEVPWLTRSQVEELAYLRIRTLEHLADLDDAVCNRIPGTYKLKQRAQKSIEEAKGNAPLVALQAEKEALTARIDALEATIKDQSAIISKLNAQQGK